jgi:GWxTD domain-containing protein
MRIKGFILSGILLSSIVAFSQTKSPEAYLGTASFTTPAGNTYFETYVTISGSSIVYEKTSGADGAYAGKVKISIEFKQGDSIKKSDTYNLLSPYVLDTNKKMALKEVKVPAQPDKDDSINAKKSTDNDNRPDFSAVKRYWLPKGDYSVQIKIEDVNNPLAKVVSVKGKVSVGYASDSVAIADAELLMSYSPSQHASQLSKSGYDMVPYVYSFYPKEMKTFSFYTEIYNTPKVFQASKFVVKYYIESADNHIVLANYTKVAVHKADTVVPVLGSFDIEKLHTGKYNLVVDVIDKDNKKIATREYSFIRNNPIVRDASMDENLATVNIAGTFVADIKNQDTLREYVRSLAPIAHTDDRYFINSVDEQSDTSLMRRFFYNFWVAHNPADPKKAWDDYYVQVKLVNRKFGTSYKKGYQTDRGRVYLQYGAPSQRDQETINADSYPYEIWEYYKLADGESDKKFIFYEPSLATNDFVLLHSTAKGEVQNRQWQQVLFGQLLMPPTSVDDNTLPLPNQNATNTQDSFDNPR